jgi:saccharopine dehydrogenase-like NADP-dependent oxidoreductase
MKRILVLGAGLVAKPLVDYLLLQETCWLTVADCELEKAEDLVNGHPRAAAANLNVANKDSSTEALGRLYGGADSQQEDLPHLIADHDLTISLLPYSFHVTVAKLCVALRKPMVTASYVSPEMQALDQEAKAAGVILLNEIGVDPGIDHMSAKRVIDDVNNRGGQVSSFSSYCGGLPAPDANTNPWGYKFSWSPRGVVMAGKNAGRYLREGEVIDIPGDKLFHHFESVSVPAAGDFEGYTNRDCLGYVDIYDLQGVESMFRGTLRYPGWCETMQAVTTLGLLNDDHRNDLKGKCFADLTRELIGAEESAPLKEAVATYLQLPVDAEPVRRLDWLGLFSDEALPKVTSVMDLLVERLSEKMSYEPGERDMLVMHHEFIGQFDDHREFLTSSLIDYGIPNGDSSMARTVSLPAAVAAKLILEGAIDAPGVQIPVTPEFYNPILAELELLGICCKEHKEVLND